MKRILIAVLLTGSILLLMIPGQAVAEYRFNDGTIMEIQWHEKQGEILNEKVCFNYEDDRRKYRQCRKKARNYFREECKYYSQKVKNSRHDEKNVYAADKAKFCSAYESYDYRN